MTYMGFGSALSYGGLTAAAKKGNLAQDLKAVHGKNGTSKTDALKNTYKASLKKGTT